MPCTGTIQLFRLPHLWTNFESTMGDHNSFKLYGQVASENTAS
jgi:hypothetical protein